MTKIAIFFINYGPYHLARLEAFERQCRQLGWQAIGIELSRNGREYKWKTRLQGFSAKIVSVFNDLKPEQTGIFYLGQQLYNIFEELSPDVIAVAGYYERSTLLALGWGILNRKPLILLSESKEDDAARSWFWEKMKRLLVNRYRSALVGGQPHKRYLLKLGMAAEAVFLGYNIVGNSTFHPAHIRHLPRPIQQPFFLAINRFIPKKNLLTLLLAYAGYYQRQGNHAWNLVLCGDGELHQEISDQVKKLDLKHVVHLPGFLQQNQLLPYFAHASCFIHASMQEQWGLVVNEAMAAGLPVLVSNRCGCYEDLVVEGVTGFGFDPENLQQLTDLMIRMSSGIVDLHQMKQESLDHIQKFSPEHFGKGLVDAVEYALSSR